MAIISKESLLKVLTSYNPWWKTGTVNPKLSKTYKRFAFYEAMKRLNQTDIRFDRNKTCRQNNDPVSNDRNVVTKWGFATENCVYFYGSSDDQTKCSE